MATGTKKVVVKKKENGKQSVAEAKKEDASPKKQPKGKFSFLHILNQKKDEVLTLVRKWIHQKTEPKKPETDSQKK